MKARAWVVSGMGAALIGLGAPGVAAAQVPACDPATAPVAQFSGLPDQLIHGRDHVFSIRENDALGWAQSDYQITMSETGEVFWSGALDYLDVSIGSAPKLYIRADPGDDPLTVSASYTEYRTDTVYSAEPTCQRVISKTMPGITGRAPGTPRVRTPYGQEGQFTLRAPDSGCAATYAPDPVAVSVKPKRASRWTTVAVRDQCAGWSGGGNGNHFRLKSLGDNGRTMLFVPRTPARNGREDFTFKISRATVAEDGSVTLGRVLRRGVLRVKTTHYPRERVYGFKPNGQINDRYWNYCVNQGKQVWMHNGNPYCIDPAVTSREVRLRR